MNKNLEHLNKTLDGLFEVANLLRSASQILEKTSNEVERQSLLEVIKNLKDLHKEKSLSLQEIELDNNQLQKDNLWSIHSYQSWAHKTKLELHSVTKVGNKYINEDNNSCQRSIIKETEIIKRYLTNQAEDYKFLIKNLQNINTMKPMEDMFRISVNVPTFNEGKNILYFLENYSLQKINALSLLDYRKFEINLILNRQKGSKEDLEGLKSIGIFRKRNPHIRLNFLSVEFEPQTIYGKRGVGLARKILTDLVLLRSISRNRQEGPLYIQSEDCDHHKVDSQLLNSVILKLDKNPHLDVVYGIQDRNPSILKQNNLVFMERRFWYFIERILQQEKLIINGKTI